MALKFCWQCIPSIVLIWMSWIETMNVLMRRKTRFNSSVSVSSHLNDHFCVWWADMRTEIPNRFCEREPALRKCHRSLIFKRYWSNAAYCLNSLAPGRCGNNFKGIIFKLIIQKTSSRLALAMKLLCCKCNLNLNLNLKKCLLDKKQIQAGNNVINDTHRVFYIGRPLQRRWAHRWRKSHPTEPQRWEVNIGSGNGLVPSGNKPLPEPILTQIYVAMHMASPGHNKQK